MLPLAWAGPGSPSGGTGDTCRSTRCQKYLTYFEIIFVWNWEHFEKTIRLSRVAYIFWWPQDTCFPKFRPRLLYF